MKKSILWIFGTTIAFVLGIYLLNQLEIEWIVRHLSKINFVSMYIMMWIPGIFSIYYAKKEGMQLFGKVKWSRFVLLGVSLPLMLTALIFLTGLHLDTLSDELINHTEIGALLKQILQWVLLGVFHGTTLKFSLIYGEELLWRGYLWEKIKHIGFWKASLILGTLCGLRHAPAVLLLGFAYPHSPLKGIIWTLVVANLYTPILLFLKEKTNSHEVPAIFRGLMGAFGPFSVALFNSKDSYLVGNIGLASFLVSLLLNLRLFVYLRISKFEVKPSKHRSSQSR